MSLSKQCGICMENYADEENSRPRILPCGHSYCHECLSEVLLGDKRCPSCRADCSRCNLADLPVCFQLLSESDDLQPAECCAKHEFALTFSCRTCKRNICRKCVVNSHEHCAFTVLEECVQILRQEMLDDLDQQEGECNTVLATTERRLREIADGRSQVKQLMESLSEYDKTLVTQRNYFERTGKKINIDISRINEKRNAIINADSQTLVNCVHDKHDFPRTKSIKDLEKTNLSVMVHAFSAVNDETSIPNFVTSFKNHLDDWQNEYTIPPEYWYFPDKGFWIIASSSVALSCLSLLKSTSIRPNAITVTVEIPWAQSTLKTFLSTVASIHCLLVLNFLDTLNRPTDESAAENEWRLNCLKVDNRRCVTKSFTGHINESVAKALLDICPDQDIDIKIVLKNSQDMGALRLITTSRKYRSMNSPLSTMELCIPRDADVASFTELPPLRPDLKYTLCFPRLGNSDLCWMMTTLKILNHSSLVGSIMFTESSVTESGLDRFLGHLLDEGIGLTDTPQTQVTAPSFGPLIIYSTTIDKISQERIKKRFADKGFKDFIQWANKTFTVVVRSSFVEDGSSQSSNTLQEVVVRVP